MPKRTNDFQTLIKTIYEQIVPQGGKVTESGMVFDREAEELREVDVLVEYRYAGHDFKFIVECRDYSRKQTVEWIDGLIGKSKPLNVNKVVAVSKRGFAKAAVKKAENNGIETLSFEEAKETDWSRFMIRPGIILTTDDVYHVEDVSYKHGDEYTSLAELGYESEVEIDGEIIGNLQGLVEYLFKEVLAPNIDEYKKSKFTELFKTKEDFSKELRIEHERDCPSFTAITQSGMRVEISRMKFVIVGKRKTVDLALDHHVFNQNMVSNGKYPDVDGSTLDFVVVQDPESRKAYISWRRTSDSKSGS